MGALAEKLEIKNPISCWEAHLQLGLTKKDDKTILSKRCHVGPLTIQRPFYPELDGTCHLYILHPPGGIVGGDNLTIDVLCDEHTSTLFTTPGASKFYKSNGFTAIQSQNLIVKEHACLEWLPQETILFDTARVHSSTRVQLSEKSSFIGWEIVSFGRPACDEKFEHGLYKQDFEIWQDDEPLLIDRVAIQDRAEVFNSLWGLQMQPVMGLMTIVNNNPIALEKACAVIQGMIKDVSRLSVTVIGPILVCRCLDVNSMSIRNIFIKIWRSIRLLILNKEPNEPRIWST